MYLGRVSGIGKVMSENVAHLSVMGRFCRRTKSSGKPLSCTCECLFDLD